MKSKSQLFFNLIAVLALLLALLPLIPKIQHFTQVSYLDKNEQYVFYFGITVAKKTYVVGEKVYVLHEKEIIGFPCGEETCFQWHSVFFLLRGLTYADTANGWWEPTK